MGIYILGIIGIAIGSVLIIKTDWFMEYFGRIGWAEAHLGTEGGTRLFYKILGVGIIILSFLVMTGTIQLLLVKLFSAGRV